MQYSTAQILYNNSRISVTLLNVTKYKMQSFFKSVTLFYKAEMKSDLIKMIFRQSDLVGCSLAHTN